ncbi:MAG: xanthine dehydrogenase family protein molybdopterin-binding subunit [Chitinophagaceae bacterium]|nr:xanthine dehydrogenase family protein molybdopterin-binding subunit [Chitinophagaceae bacterium]
MSYPSTVDRRRFLRLSGLTGLGLTAAMGVELSAWINIDKNGLVTLLSHRAEMGQGAYQSVPQIIAEELEVRLEDIQIEFAPGHPSKFGSQITGGSSTIRGAYKQLLRTSAAAREMLIAAAAQQWKVPATECHAKAGEVVHAATGRKLAYGALVETAAKLKAPAQVPLKLRKDYQLIGKPLPRKDTPLKVNGSAIFGLDKVVPGMLHAVVERSPRWHGKVKSFNADVVKALPGVKAVFKVVMPVFAFEREGVAIVATNTWAAMQARKQLKVEWDDSSIPVLASTGQLYQQMTADLEKPGNSIRTGGNFERTYTEAAKKLEAVYQTPYEAHACMEPLNCVAHWQQDKVEIWGPIQAPDWVQGDIAGRLNLKPEQVIVNMTFLGGGFGRKAFTDYTAEAVFISKEVKAPVKVTWTREDDMTQGPFRPGAMYKCRAALNGERIAAFETRMAGQNMGLQESPRFDRNAFNENLMEGLCEPYIDAFRHYSFSDVPTETPVPVMWWRSVYASTNTFAYESFMDELAQAAGKDPLAFRRSHLPAERHQALLARLAEVSGWNQRKKGEGYGMALTQCFGSIVGEVVKVSKANEGGVKIDKVWAVVDCGWYVNPDIVQAQVEGSVYMALGAAVTHETHFADGKAVETNFLDYNLPRIGDIGKIEVYLMDNEEKAGGVGEPGLPPFAPALCNAIFDLTGKRIRKLPFSLQEL